MINFVTELPPVLEPNSIYYIEGSIGNAIHYVSDSEGNAKPVSTEQLMQNYMNSLKGAANGYAPLDGSSTLPIANMPTGSKPAEINSAISSVQSSLQSSINQKADSGAVYTKTQVDSIESGLQGQVDGKQAQLSNEAAIVKLGDGSYNGKPMVLLTATQW